MYVHAFQNIVLKILISPRRNSEENSLCTIHLFKSGSFSTPRIRHTFHLYKINDLPIYYAHVFQVTWLPYTKSLITQPNLSCLGLDVQNLMQPK